VTSEKPSEILGQDFLTDLPLPEVVSWPIFPFKGDLAVRTVRPFADSDRPRSGEPGGSPCNCSDDPDAEESLPAIWSNDRWVVRPLRFGDDQAPFPAYMLETVDHMDFEDFDETYAAEYGVMCMRLDRAIRSIGSIGRVHMNRWGDGGSHFHVWFLGRPHGAWQLSGFALPFWGFVLPPMSGETHRGNDRVVAASLAKSESQAG
jgi:hypothetical protein